MAGNATSKPSPRRRRLGWLLYVLLVAAAVFAAWQAHIFLAMRSGEGQAPGEYQPAPAAGPPELSGNPLDFADEPLAGVPLEPFDGDPAGIKPPPGATWAWGFKRTVEDQRQVQAAYDYDGPVEQAAEHYRQQARQKGYRPYRDQPETGGRRLTFTMNGQLCSIALHKPRPKATIVQIVVTVIIADQVATQPR